MNILFFLIPKVKLSFLYDHFSVRQGLEKCRATGYTAVPVINKDTGEYVGTVSEGDFLWEIVDNHDVSRIKDLENIPLKNIIKEEKYPSVKVDAKIDDLLTQIMAQNFVPIVDDRGVFMGIITRRRVIEYYYNKERCEDKEA